MKKALSFLAMLFVALNTIAQEKNKKITFDVEGHCQMCKIRIEKAALKVPGVKYADWNMPTHELSLVIDERKINTMNIKTALAAVGHDTQELKATQEIYNKMHHCCRYREAHTNHN